MNPKEEASEMNQAEESFARLQKKMNNSGIDVEPDIWDGTYPVQLRYSQLVDFDIEVFHKNWVEKLEEHERKALEFLRKFHWIEMLQLGTTQPVMKAAFDDSRTDMDLIMAGGLEMPSSENRERVYEILTQMGYEKRIMELKIKGVFSVEQEETHFRVLKAFVENKMKNHRHILEMFIEDRMWEAFQQAEREYSVLEKHRR